MEEMLGGTLVAGAQMLEIENLPRLGLDRQD
jgi:hypothetical protein